MFDMCGPKLDPQLEIQMDRRLFAAFRVAVIAYALAAVSDALDAGLEQFVLFFDGGVRVT